MSKTVYISGPMRGYAENNRKAFYRAEAALQALGYVVFNPARLDDESPSKLDWSKDYDRKIGMLRDLMHVLGADGIVLLQDWQLSRGAVAEVTTAEWADKFAIYQRKDLSFGPEEGLHLFTHTIGKTKAGLTTDRDRGYTPDCF